MCLVIMIMIMIIIMILLYFSSSSSLLYYNYQGKECVGVVSVLLAAIGYHVCR